jgi:radical SAM protein with 4Fe4S-binding SPASM domain
MNNSWSIQEFENAYLEFQMKRGDQKSDYWRGSDMGACARKRIYTRKGIQPTELITSRQHRTMDVGNLFHTKYQRFFKKLGILIEKEGEIVNEEYHFKGHFDALLGGIPKPVRKEDFTFKGKDGKEFFKQDEFDWFNGFLSGLNQRFPTGLPLLLYELKTQHSMSFQYIEKKPQPEHYYQLCSYLYFLKDKYPELKEGRILYISKDDSRLCEHIIRLNDETIEQIESELKQLNEYWKKDELPPQLEEIENGRINWKCSYCPFLTHCRGEGWVDIVSKKIKGLKSKKK